MFAQAGWWRGGTFCPFLGCRGDRWKAITSFANPEYCFRVKFWVLPLSAALWCQVGRFTTKNSSSSDSNIPRVNEIPAGSACMQPFLFKSVKLDSPMLTSPSYLMLWSGWARLARPVASQRRRSQGGAPRPGDAIPAEHQIWNKWKFIAS